MAEQAEDQSEKPRSLVPLLNQLQGDRIPVAVTIDRAKFADFSLDNARELKEAAVAALTRLQIPSAYRYGLSSINSCSQPSAEMRDFIGSGAIPFIEKVEALQRLTKFCDEIISPPSSSTILDEARLPKV